MWISYLLNFKYTVLNLPKALDFKGRIGSVQEAM